MKDWIDKDLVKKNRLYKLWITKKTPETHDEYLRCKKSTAELITKAKQVYHHKMFSAYSKNIKRHGMLSMKCLEESQQKRISRN
jgi:hypothetical protein